MDYWQTDDNGVLVSGPHRAALSPEDAKLGQEVWLLPGGAVTTPPPRLAAGQAALWDARAWTVLADHRGETWWRADRSAVQITRLGDPAALGLMRERPPPPAEVREPLDQAAPALPVYERATDLPLLTEQDAGRLVVCFDAYGAGRRGLVFWDGDEWRRAKDGSLVT